MFTNTYISCESIYVQVQTSQKTSSILLNAALDDSFHMQTYVYTWKVDIKNFSIYCWYRYDRSSRGEETPPPPWHKPQINQMRVSMSTGSGKKKKI